MPPQKLRKKMDNLAALQPTGQALHTCKTCGKSCHWLYHETTYHTCSVSHLLHVDLSLCCSFHHLLTVSSCRDRMSLSKGDDPLPGVRTAGTERMRTWEGLQSSQGQLQVMPKSRGLLPIAFRPEPRSLLS